MLRVTVEVVPGGDERAKRTIGLVAISRRTTDMTVNPCDYDVHLTQLGKRPGERDGWHAVVKDHEYSQGAWVLITRAIEEILADGGGK